MRVLLVSPAMGVGGAERVVVGLAQGLPAHGAHVALAAPAGALDSELSPRTARFILRAGGRSPLQLARLTGGIARTLRSVRPDLVHAHNPKASLASGLALRTLGGPRPPLLATFHGVTPSEYAPAVRLLALADHVACVSEDARAQLVGAGAAPENLTVIENGVPLPPEPSAPEQAALDRELGLDGGAVVTAVGRLVAQKAHDRFLHMAATVAALRPGTRFLVLGDGPRRAELELLSRQLGLSDQVAFLGQRQDARAIIGRSDLLVFSSDWEGLSIAALEALAAGVPVVSTPVQGMRVLHESGAGEVVGEQTAEALAGSVLRLLEDAGARRRMSEAGRGLIAGRFGVERMTAAYAALYARICAV
ncbi:MAG TPA: glycosyltransferase [Solirubrobacteraceae bacterium]|nr:glycosyltransferase [Solirubrobacteraceae bacterium]